MASKFNKKQLVKTLQIFAAYLVAAWTFLQFVDWVLNRYNISPYWVDILLWFFIGIVPSLLIYLYHQERINKRVLKLREKIIFPLNIGLLFIALYFGFGNSDLGATTKEVTFTNFDGEIESRTITKQEFRVDIPICNFDQVTLDSTSLWMNNVVNNLLYYDLQQDKNLSPYLRSGGTTVEKVNLLKPFCDYYVDGEFEKKDSLFIITPFIRNSQNGKILYQKTFEGKDLLNIIDDISIFVKDNVGIIKENKNRYIDLNLKDFVTKSMEALEVFNSGNYRKAVEIDSTFALAYYLDASRAIKLSRGQLEEQRLTDKAYQHRQRLPLQKQLQVLIQRNMAYNNWEDAEELIKLQLEIDPNDNEYQNLLYACYAEARAIDKYVNYADSNFNKVKNSQSIFKQLNTLNISGEYDKALGILSKYQMIYPDLKNLIAQQKIKPLILNNDYKEAKEVLRKIELLNPDRDIVKMVVNEFKDAIDYREKNKSKIKDYSTFIGTYRQQNNEQTREFFEHNDAVISHVSSQGLYAPIKASSDLLVDFGENEWRRFKFLKDSINTVYALKLTITYFYERDPLELYYWKEDHAINKAISLLKSKTINDSKLAYEDAIKKYPNHFYLKEHLKHIQYLQSIDSVSLQSQFSKIVGKYGNREFWVENGKLYYKRGGLALRELHPISENRYLSFNDYGIQMAFEFKNDTIASLAYLYNLETREWDRLDDEDNYLIKDN